MMNEREPLEKVKYVAALAKLKIALKAIKPTEDDLKLNQLGDFKQWEALIDNYDLNLGFDLTEGRLVLSIRLFDQHYHKLRLSESSGRSLLDSLGSETTLEIASAYINNRIRLAGESENSIEEARLRSVLETLSGDVAETVKKISFA